VGNIVVGIAVAITGDSVPFAAAPDGGFPFMNGSPIKYIHAMNAITTTTLTMIAVFFVTGIFLPDRT
jgi:hypothetical protein